MLLNSAVNVRNAEWVGVRTTRCVPRMALLVVMGRRRSPSFPLGACIRDGSLRIGARIKQTHDVQQCILRWFRAKTRDRIMENVQEVQRPRSTTHDGVLW
jgi:hypothetical protein